MTAERRKGTGHHLPGRRAAQGKDNHGQGRRRIRPASLGDAAAIRAPETITTQPQPLILQTELSRAVERESRVTPWNDDLVEKLKDEARRIGLFDPDLEHLREYYKIEKTAFVTENLAGQREYIDYKVIYQDSPIYAPRTVARMLPLLDMIDLAVSGQINTELHKALAPTLEAMTRETPSPLPRY